MTIDALQSLLAEICQKNGMPALAFDEDQMVTTPFGEGQVLNLRYREDADELTLLASLGEVPPHAQAAALMELMKGNFNRPADAGVFAWCEAVGQPVLQRRIACEGLTAAALDDVLTRVLTVADASARQLSRLSADLDPDEQEYGGGIKAEPLEDAMPPSDLMNPDVIRG